MPVVLVVEDEAQVLVMAESILHESGYQTVTASTPAEALALMEPAQGRDIDLLFADISLKEDHDGLQIGKTFAEKMAWSSRPLHLRARHYGRHDRNVRETLRVSRQAIHATTSSCGCCQSSRPGRGDWKQLA
jgi:DNA-binding response OmpR family regulator